MGTSRKIDFLSLFCADLLNEIQLGEVHYQGICANYEDFIYVKHQWVCFNNHSNIWEYRHKLGKIHQKTLMKVEKELYDNAAWMVNFNLGELMNDELIAGIENLKSFFNFEISEEGRLNSGFLTQIIFKNTGKQVIYNEIECEEMPTDITNERAREIFKTELEDFSKLFLSQLDKLKVDIQWIFYKFIQNIQHNSEDLKNKSLTNADKLRLKALLSQDQIGECIDEMMLMFEENNFICHQLILLSRRYNRSKNDRASNVRSLSEIEIEENKIVDSILNLIR